MSAIIYKLSSKKYPSLIYIGSTILSLNNRLGNHKREAREFIAQRRVFRSSCRLAIKDDVMIQVLESCPEEDRLYREQLYMIMAKLIYKKGYTNKRWAIPLSTLYHVNNYNKRKKEENPEDWKKNKAENNKRYREGKHREIILEKKRDYHQKNKERVNAMKKQKVLCECGLHVSKSCIARHRKSLKHSKYLRNKNIQS
tara:strand:+ start:174 stop:767 length:594 start_codon:yes stop_codon:yes gene_type:complete